MSVGENIRRIRQSKGITQTFIANKAGTTPALICQIERGTKNPSLQVGKAIAEALGCRMEDLLDENPEGVSNIGNESGVDSSLSEKR